MKPPPSDFAALFSSRITFSVNGVLKSLENPSPSELLVDYLRRNGLTGVKNSCGEGVCGSCTVVISRIGESKTAQHISINSCLRLVSSLDGFEITTTEGMGTQRTGFHPIQTRIAERGTQCGYCTPGFVSQMYGLLLNNPTPDRQTIEDNFQGNLCRCTGYRPIMKAMQAFSREEMAHSTFQYDASQESKELVSEELHNYTPRPLYFTDHKKQYFRPLELIDVERLVKHFSDVPTRLMVGNTSIGLNKHYNSHPSDNPEVFIDISKIEDFQQIKKTGDGVRIGAAVSISEMVGQFDNEQHSIYGVLSEHLKKSGNSQVRNSGSWAGNFMTTKAHPEFPSDLTTIFGALGCTVGYICDGQLKQESVIDFLESENHRDLILCHLLIPSFNDDQNIQFKTFKVMPRPQNARAIINAAMRVDCNEDGTVKAASIVYGGLHPGLFVANHLQEHLAGKKLDASTLTSSLQILGKEVAIMPPADQGWVVSSTEYRSTLVRNLFYKFVIGIQTELESSLQSAAQSPSRSLSEGTQIFTAGEKHFPVGQPLWNLSAKIQASGEAIYTDDNSNLCDGYYGHPVLSTVSKAKLLSVDASAALQLDGVIDFVSAPDIDKIGGMNECGVFPGDEEIFASKEIICVGQQIGFIVATSKNIAVEAANLVKIEYGPADSPAILSLHEAIEQKSFLPNIPNKTIPAPDLVEIGNVNDAFSKADHTISGEIAHGSQHHFYMEPMSACAFPDENDAIKLIVSTQGPSIAHQMLMPALGLPGNKIIVETKRLGGAFGGKEKRCFPNLAAVAIACRKLNRPVRCQLDRITDMQSVGKRHPHLCRYKVGYNNDGKIIALERDFYNDGGCTYELTPIDRMFVQWWGDCVYKIPNYRSTSTACRTNFPTNTVCRAPGSLSAVFFTEHIIDHIAHNSGLDATLIRELNFYSDGDRTPQNMLLSPLTLPKVWKVLKSQSKIDGLIKETNEFNSQNRWRKRGVSMTPGKYIAHLNNFMRNAAIVNIHEDGSVLVTHGGIEMGQGIHTKVAQAISYRLGVPISRINTHDSSTKFIPNYMATVASITSEAVVQAALLACDDLNARLQPYKDKMQGSSWDQIIKAAAFRENLSATGFFAPRSPDFVNYFIFCGAVSVVEIDVLTGELDILSTDIVYDCGDSLNPAVDIGQVEGAYIMGVGLMTTEEIVTDSQGAIQSLGAWDYFIPCSKSIPVKFNVTLLDNEPNPHGILGSKASGEPSIILSTSVHLAIKNAIFAARRDAGNDSYFRLDAPCTVEKIQQACQTSDRQLTLSAEHSKMSAL